MVSSFLGWQAPELLATVSNRTNADRFIFSRLGYFRPWNLLLRFRGTDSLVTKKSSCLPAKSDHFFSRHLPLAWQLLNGNLKKKSALVRAKQTKPDTMRPTNRVCTFFKGGFFLIRALWQLRNGCCCCPTRPCQAMPGHRLSKDTMATDWHWSLQPSQPD